MRRITCEIRAIPVEVVQGMLNAECGDIRSEITRLAARLTEIESTLNLLAQATGEARDPVPAGNPSGRRLLVSRILLDLLAAHPEGLRLRELAQVAARQGHSLKLRSAAVLLTRMKQRGLVHSEEHRFRLGAAPGEQN